MIFTVISVNISSGSPNYVFYRTLARFISILSPTIVLGFLSCMQGAMLEAEKIYWPNKMISLLTSIFVILSVLLLFRLTDIVSIFIGEIVALCAHIFLLSWLIRKNRIPVSVGISKSDCDTVSVWRKSVPLMISTSVYSINSLIDKGIAVSITEGSATVLQYARILSLDLFPTIIVTAFSGLLINEFAELAVQDRPDLYGKKVCEYMEAMTGFLGVVAIVSIVNSESLISVAFQRGQFDISSVKLTNSAFIGYVTGIPFFPLREVAARAHYGFKDTKTPFISSMAGVVCNVILSVILSRFTGLWGIAIATSAAILISGIINMCVLVNVRKVCVKGFGIETGKIILALAILVPVNILLRRVMVGHAFICIALCAFISLVVFYTLAYVLKMRSLKIFIKLIERKYQKS